MVYKTFKYTLNVLAAVLAGLCLVLLVFAWKLSQGPISLPQLTPYIVEALSNNTRGMSIRIEDTTLSWEGWDRTLDLKVIEARVFTRDGRLLFKLPEVSTSLSGKALFEGIIAPHSLEVMRPEVHLLRNGDGSFAFDFGGELNVDAERTLGLDALLSKDPHPERPLSYLRSIELVDADFEYVDRTSGQTLNIPKTNLSIERIGENYLLETTFDFMINEQKSNIAFGAIYNLTSQITDVEMQVGTLRPSDLLSMLPHFEWLDGLDFMVNGKLSASIDVEGHVRSFFSDLTSPGGTLMLERYNVPALPIDTMALKASYEDLDGALNVQEATIALKPDTLVSLPAQLDHALPLEVLRLKGLYKVEADRFDFVELFIDLGEGPTATIKGVLDGVLKGPERKIDVTGELLNVDVAKLGRYWPPALNDDAHDWVTQNLTTGTVHRAGIDLSLSLAQDMATTVHHIHGDMEMSGVTGTYLNPLPPFVEAAGWAKFDHQNFNITVTEGRVGNIELNEAQLDIMGLDLHDQTMAVDLTVTGPFRETLEFIDKDPLGFASALGINPSRTSGDVTTNLNLEFMLLDDLRFDDVKVSATANGTDIRIEDVVFGQPLSEGQIGLYVDKTGMDVTGDILLGTIPAELNWRESFDPEDEFKRRFELSAIVNDSQRMKELRLDFPPFNDKIMTGTIKADATIVEDWDGLGEMDISADLQGAKITIPALNWVKDQKTEGKARARLTFREARLLAVPSFSVSSKGLLGRGAIKFDADQGSLRQITIEEFKAGRTHVASGTVLYSPKNGWEVDVQGEDLDLTGLFQELKKRDDSDTEKTKQDDGRTNLPGTFSVRFNRIWLDEVEALNTVAGAITSDGNIWTEAHMTGNVSAGKPFMIDLSPEGENRRLKMETKDAGALLKGLDIFDDMEGGELVIDGVINDQVATKPLVGNISVQNYRIVEVPALAKILSLVALTGVLDSLQGEGIGFSSLTSPFKLEEGVFDFKDGRTNGISIGLTWEGKVYTHANVADLRGTIVPMYGLNSLLANVPVLGNLFSSGEKGGGLFAWTFKVTGDIDDPDVNINPVSALAPGVLRRIFQLDTPGSSPPPLN